MPHCVVEHAGVLHDEGAVSETLGLCLAVCAGSGIMQREDVKVRSLPAQAILFGDGRTSFVHVTVSMLAGRTDGQKSDLADALRGALRERWPQAASISVDIRDMNPACYRKSLA